jgi:signal transduction histidine kinase
MNTENPARLLIVDDTPTNIEVLLGMLEDDYDVSFATSGRQALELLAREAKPDLILLDVMMPEMDGYSVCDALKADPATRAIPVIFVTAKTDTESERHALSSGAVDFIHKPVNQAVVRARVALHLELERRAQALSMANAELAQHRDHLEELVLARSRELAEARDEAEAANRAKSAFLANMGHELRTPLNHILGQVYLLQRDIPDESIRERLGLIERPARHLLQIINDLLDLSRLEADRIRLVVEDFDLSTLCVRLEDRYREEVSAKGLTILCTVDPALPACLQGDRNRLDQILDNLLNNAIKFSEQGQITVRARLVEVHEGDVTVRFEVDDQGIGIDPEVQANLFQPFYQGDGTTTRRYQGTGLGLALCQRLVSLMAGQIGVESRLGQGSTFWFSVRLPIGVAAPGARTEVGSELRVVDWVQLRKAVTLLSDRLEDGDIEAKILFSDSPDLYEPVLKERYEAFKDALAAFDFDLARQLLLEGIQD